MRYIEARLHREQSEKIYRIYITQCLQAIAGNTSGHTKSYVKKTFEEVSKEFFYKSRKDSRSGEDIAKDVVSRIGLKFSEE